MFELERAIGDWRSELCSRGVKGPETLDELEGHLRDDFEEQVRSGMEIQQAFDAARERIGRSESLRLEFRKIRSTELFFQLKNALFTLFVPKYALTTNMNTSIPTSNVEARWASYLKAGTFLAPSLILWTFSCMFMVPKLKQICDNAGFTLPTILQAMLGLASHPMLILVAMISPILVLEWRSSGWPKYRRMTLGTGVFVINALILVLITMMVFSALMAAPAMAHPAK
jgi:hypothetical protein